MFSTLALIAVATAAPAPASTNLPTGPFDPLTAFYHAKTGSYCVRSGWQTATWQTGFPVRAGDCRTAAQWRQRGLAFAPVDGRSARGVNIVAR